MLTAASGYAAISPAQAIIDVAEPKGILAIVGRPDEAASRAIAEQVLGEPLGRVRRLLDDRHLIGSKRTGVFAVPEVFVVDGEPLGSLRGTVIVLQDAGFSDDELIDLTTQAEVENADDVASCIRDSCQPR